MEDLSQAFKALGHPHRLVLVRRLIERIRTGRRVHCRINADRLNDLCSFLALPSATPSEG
jgi:hypothetical protein